MLCWRNRSGADPDGNLPPKTDRNGTVFTYTYDRLGRVLSATARRMRMASSTPMISSGEEYDIVVTP